MSGAAAATLMAIQSIQVLLSDVQSNLNFGSYWCPLDSPIDTITSTSFDYIIVGGGSAGSVLTNRLSACKNKKVLLLEAGGCPPLESLCTGYFPLLPRTAYDYNMTAVNDFHSCQNLQGGSAGLTAGKMLGGTSSLNHGIWDTGAPDDYNLLATITGDPSWSYEKFLPYFKKSITVSNESLDKKYAAYYGTDGPINLKKQPSAENKGILNAFAELGYTIANNLGADKFTNIAGEPFVTIGNDGLRQGGLKYISLAKDRDNLYVLTKATVSKVVINDQGVATGVTFTYGHTSYTAMASEVILAAGSVITPQLLMLSGVGPSEHLTEIGITTISDLPVGDNLQDHVTSPMIFSLGEDTANTVAPNPFNFPVPVTTSYINLENETASYPSHMSINLVIPHDFPGLLQLCTNVFKYSNDICDAINNANAGKKLLLSATTVLHPVSRGNVRLPSNNIDDHPLVTLGLYSSNADLVNMAKYLNHTAQLVNTAYFKSVGAEYIDTGLCSNFTLYSTEYWQCHALAMSCNMWFGSGTTAMGSVVDSNGMVIGVSNLRVVGSSIFSRIPGGTNYAAIVAVAEKIADVIISGCDTCTIE